MDIQLSQIFVPTTNKAHALKFLTFIFDCEILTDERNIDYTVLGGAQLYFLETDNQLVQGTPFCSFRVSDQAELENIKQKIQFFCYREDIEIPSFELTENCFNFFDFDGNLWKINYSRVFFSNALPLM